MRTDLAILIVEGHTGVRDALAGRLGQMPGVGMVRVASTVDAATEIARHLGPDLVLYDPRTVIGDAAEGVRRLGATGGAVVILTSSLSRDDAVDVWAAGAAAVLLKGSGTAELQAAIAAARAHARMPGDSASGNAGP